MYANSSVVFLVNGQDQTPMLHLGWLIFAMVRILPSIRLGSFVVRRGRAFRYFKCCHIAMHRQIV